MAEVTERKAVAAQERRERIATAALQGLLAHEGFVDEEVAIDAVNYADILIAALDAEPGKGGGGR